MQDDIETRMLRLFDIRLQNDSTISPTFQRILLENSRDNDFGEDEQLYEGVVSELSK